MIIIILINKIISNHFVILIYSPKTLHKIIFSKVMDYCLTIYHKTETVIKKILLKMMILKMVHNV